MKNAIIDKAEAYRYIKSCYNAIKVIKYKNNAPKDKVEIEDLIKYFILGDDRIQSFLHIKYDRTVNERKHIIIKLLKMHFPELSFPINVNSKIVLHSIKNINHMDFNILKTAIISYLELLIVKISQKPSGIHTQEQINIHNVVI